MHDQLIRWSGSISGPRLRIVIMIIISGWGRDSVSGIGLKHAWLLSQNPGTVSINAWPGSHIWTLLRCSWGQSFALFAFASLSKVFPMKHKEFKATWPIVVLWKLRWHQLVGFPVNWRHWHTNRRSCHSTATTLVCLQKHTYFLQISNTNTLFKK